MPGRRRKFRSLILLYILSAVPVVLLDRLTKIWVHNGLDQGDSIPLIKGVLHLTLVHNTGAAFGMFSGYPQIFICVSVLSLIIINYVIWTEWDDLERIETISLLCILGGAVGNLIDRSLHGYVIDFIDIRVWPVFNIADSFITTGAVILGIFLLNRVRKSSISNSKEE